MTATWRKQLRRWWAMPVTRALLALLLMMVIGCAFNAGGVCTET